MSLRNNIILLNIECGEDITYLFVQHKSISRKECESVINPLVQVLSSNFSNQPYFLNKYDVYSGPELIF